MTYRKNIFAVFAIAAVLALSPTMATSFAQVAPVATPVIGQPDLSTNDANLANSQTLAKPQSLVYDNDSNLWIVDTQNDRVVMFAAEPVTKEIVDTTADLVLGQPDVNVIIDPSQVSDIVLEKPVAIAIDSSDNVYVVDAENNRVVMFVDPITTDAVADVVIGQPDMTTKVAIAPTAETLSNPTAVEVVEIKDPRTQQVIDEKVIIADANNNRVLVYDQETIVSAIENPTVPVRAEFVIGQKLMTENTRNMAEDVDNNRIITQSEIDVAVQADTLSTPVAIATVEQVDPITQILEQKLVIADQDNHRVLVYSLPIVENAPAAEIVIGQVDVDVAQVVIPPTAQSLRAPSAIAVDTVNDRLLIADKADNRVLEYVLPITQDAQQAVEVIGQKDLISAKLQPVVTSETIVAPQGVAFDPVTKKVAIADTENNRIVIVEQSIKEQAVAPLMENDLPAMEIENLDLPRDVAVVETQHNDKIVVVAEEDADRVQVFELTEEDKVVEIATIENLVEPTSVAVVEVIDPVTQVEKLQLVVVEETAERVLVFETLVEAPFQEPITRADAIVIEQADGLELVSPQDVEVIEIADPRTPQIVEEKLAIADTQNDRVLIYDLPIVESIVEPTTIIAENIVEPTVIAADPINEQVLVVVEATTAPRVVVYDLNQVVEPTIVPVAQKVLDITIPQEVSVTETTVVPSGIAVDPVTAHIVIADIENDRVLEFAPITTEIVKAPAIVELVAIAEIETVSEITPKTINQPEQVVIVDDKLWIADPQNDRVVAIQYAPVVESNQVDAQVTIVESQIIANNQQVAIDVFADSTSVALPEKICGVQVDTTSLDYGVLQLDQISTEAQIVLANAGNTPVEVFVKSAPWVDAAGVEQISIENTKFSLVSEAASGLTPAEHFTQMTPAATTFSPILDVTGQPVELEEEAPLTTHWKMQADLLNQQFTGSLSQTMEFGITC